MIRRCAATLIITLCLAGQARAHHISSSASNWELRPESVSVDFQYPIEDIVILVAPDHVFKGETYVQLIKPLEDELRERMTVFINDEITHKIRLDGCEYSGPLDVRYTSSKIFVHAELTCRPGYGDRLKLEDRFLVEVNNLHVSLATLHTGGEKLKCLFRTGLHVCKPGSPTSVTDNTIPWKDVMGGGNVLVFHGWEQWCFLALLIIASANFGAFAMAIGAFVSGGLLAMIGLSAGRLPEPSLLKPLVPMALIYGALAFHASRGPWGARGWYGYWGAHLLLTLLSLSVVIKAPAAAVVGMALLGYGIISVSAPEDSDDRRNRGMFIFAALFGLLHGFSLADGLRNLDTLGLSGVLAGLGFDTNTGMAPYAIMALSIPALAALRVKCDGDRWKIAGAALIGVAGLYWFFTRGMTLPGIAMDYRESVKALEDIIQAPEFGPRLLLISMLLALVLGALHALTPGHGKTVVAAYLVGSKGRVIDAMILGATVTITHTASVLLLGVIALVASREVLPKDLTPWLGSMSGIIIVIMGAAMFLARYRNWRRTGEAVTAHFHGPDEHDHDSTHDQPHDHDHHDHSHDHGHSHKTGVRAIDLITLGVSGGMVPCPDAFVVLLLAVAINRIALGLLVILVFSLGMAAVLIAIGIMMVKARPLVEKFGGGGIVRVYLPFASAILVTALGAYITYRSASLLF